MQTALLHADTRASAQDRARVLERKLDEFHPLFRARVRTLAEGHPRLKDLAASFPALLFALAAPRGGIDHERGVALVIEGVRLKDVAAAVELPMWLRRFPARAFSRVIPVLPDGELVARQIVNHAPKKMRHVSDWLGIVSDAYLWADAEVAVWGAREFRPRPAMPRGRLARNRVRDKWIRLRRRVCLWAWYCRHVPNDPCLATARWSPSMTMDTALSAANEWEMQLSLWLMLGDGSIQDAWASPGHVAGFDFVPLLTYRDIVDEGLAMEHCVRTYGSCIASDSSRIWSLRRDGVRVATLELSLVHQSPTPIVTQIKMKKNKRAPAGIWLAARTWLHEQSVSHRVERVEKDRAPLNANAWRAMWLPYWRAKRQFPKWLPLNASREAWDDL